jgi:hypothetical protein
VNIDGGQDVIVRRRWQKPLNHRSRARPALDVAVPVEGLLPQLAPNVTPVAQGTRFHITARVTVSDRSLWIPVGGYRRGTWLSQPTSISQIDVRLLQSSTHIGGGCLLRHLHMYVYRPHVTCTGR